MTKFNCRCTLKGLTDLQLDEKKKDLMKDSQFYRFLNVKEKSTSSFLVHRFFEFYKVDDKHFEVNQKAISIDVNDIARMTGLKASVDPYEKSGSRDIPAWYRALCEKYPYPTKEKEEENITKKRKKDNSVLHQLRKKVVSRVLRAMHVDTKEAQENFRKLLCYFLICFYVDAPSDDVGGVHHFADVADLEKFEKICWAQVMLCNIIDCAEKVSSQKSRSYITCNSPVVEALVYDKLPDMFDVQTRSDWKEGVIGLNKFEEKKWSNKNVMELFAGDNNKKLVQNKTQSVQGVASREMDTIISLDDKDVSLYDSIANAIEEREATSFLFECIDDALRKHPDVSRSDLITKLQAHYFVGEASNSDLLLNWLRFH